MHGEAAWNGVAILSRAGLEDVVAGIPGGPGFPEPEARAVSATCGGIRVVSVYVPNGRTPDSDHYRYKLEWLAALKEMVAAGGPEAAIVCGDINIAPADADVFDPEAYEGQTHVTAPERAALADLQALGLRDVVRERWPDERVFSYWDYRAGMFHQDLGMRIDLLLAGGPVADRVEAAWVDRQARKGKGPSDHAPVIVDLDEAPDGDIGPVVPAPLEPEAGARLGQAAAVLAAAGSGVVRRSGKDAGSEACSSRRATEDAARTCARRAERADDGPRTRDLKLGKLALYQLSYVRVTGRVPGVLLAAVRHDQHRPRRVRDHAGGDASQQRCAGAREAARPQDDDRRVALLGGVDDRAPHGGMVALEALADGPDRHRLRLQARVGDQLRALLGGGARPFGAALLDLLRHVLDHVRDLAEATRSANENSVSHTLTTTASRGESRAPAPVRAARASCDPS